MQALVGKTVGPYEVEALLGEGGMAVVYRVRHPALGKTFAMKVLTLNRSDIRERFLQEGRVQASLHHPNIVSVFDVAEVEGAPALVMEYAGSRTLLDLIRAGPMNLEDVEPVFKGVVAGVAAAHKQGVVHRDLKPGNVLLVDGDPPFPKVADFGLAKLADGDSGNTRTGTTMGTPSYMAPEQIRDAKHVDARADVFALGAILYELVTGRQAFPGDDILTVMTAVASGNYPPPETIVPGLPDRFVRTIRGALEVDPAKRFASCEALLDALKEKTASPAARGAPSLAPPAPARRASTAGPLAAVAVGGFGVVGIGLALAAVAAVAVALTAGGDAAPALPSVSAILAPVDPKRPCGGKDGEVVGFLNHRGVLLKRKGSSWTLPGEKPVYTHAPGEKSPDPTDADVVCRLPEGTRLKLVESPLLVGGKGAWLAVAADAYTVPEPPPAP